MTTKPNPLHVTVTEHAQPHAFRSRALAAELRDVTPAGSIIFYYERAQMLAKELRAAADYIEQREQQWGKLRTWLDELLLHELQHDSVLTEMDRLDAALRATGATINTPPQESR